MKTLPVSSIVTILILSSVYGHALDFGATTDLWDISQGTTITASSAFDAAFGSPHPYDARDMFGGHFGDFSPEYGDVVFNDEQPAGFVHFVQWKTLAPITMGSFKLYAAEDALGQNQTQRSIASFKLLAKSPGSLTYDLTLFQFTPSNPYGYVDASQWLLLSQTITPVTAQDFRAEFVDRGGTPYGGPRVIELDAFVPVPEPSATVLSGMAALIVFGWRARRSSLA